MPIYLRRSTYFEMYEQNLDLISLANLVQDGDQNTAPITRIHNGRPRKQSLHAGETRIRNSHVAIMHISSHVNSLIMLSQPICIAYYVL